jgi:hypothetical protein
MDPCMQEMILARMMPTSVVCALHCQHPHTALRCTHTLVGGLPAPGGCCTLCCSAVLCCLHSCTHTQRVTPTLRLGAACVCALSKFLGFRGTDMASCSRGHREEASRTEQTQLCLCCCLCCVGSSSRNKPAGMILQTTEHPALSWSCLMECCKQVPWL